MAAAHRWLGELFDAFDALSQAPVILGPYLALCRVSRGAMENSAVVRRSRATLVVTARRGYKSMTASAHPRGENTCNVTGGGGSAVAVYSSS